MNKKRLFLLVLLFAFAYVVSVYAQDNSKETSTNPNRPTTTAEKRERNRNQVVKEWNTDAKGKRKWMDHLTVWDERGLKIEEIEYAVYGQKERITYEYDAEEKCIRENVYNDKNKLYRIRKYEYNEDGRKKVQYNYNPDGKLYSTKIFDYSYQ
jgi:hypothetical protein